MNSRMDKYQTLEKDKNINHRTQRNKKLYDEVQDMNIDYIDINVNDAIEITPDKELKKTRSDYQMKKEIEKILPSEAQQQDKKEEIKQKQERVYDINEILKLARDNKLFEEEKNKKYAINTEYNILTKLDINKINDKEDMTKESLRNLINSIYQTEDEIYKTTRMDVLEDKDENNAPKENNSIEETTNTNDLLGDLMTKDEDEMIINTEISKEILDIKESKPSSKDITITDVKLKDNLKEAQETDEDIEENILEEDKKSKTLLVVVIIIVIILLAIAGYLFYKYFGTL